MLIKFIIMITFMSMMWWRKNIIILLLSLELIIISSLCVIMHFNQFSSYLYMILMLSFMVSGSSIGLSLLVSLSRSFNSSNSIFIWSLISDKINFSIDVPNNF